MTSDCATRKGLFDHSKVTCNKFASLYRGQKGHLSRMFFYASGWSCHGKVGKGEGNAAGDD